LFSQALAKENNASTKVRLGVYPPSLKPWRVIRVKRQGKSLPVWMATSIAVQLAGCKTKYTGKRGLLALTLLSEALAKDSFNPGG